MKRLTLLSLILTGWTSAVTADQMPPKPELMTLICYYPDHQKMVKYLGAFTITEQKQNYVAFYNKLNPREHFALSGKFIVQPVYPQKLPPQK